MVHSVDKNCNDLSKSNLSKIVENQDLSTKCKLLQNNNAPMLSGIKEIDRELKCIHAESEENQMCHVTM